MKIISYDYEVLTKLTDLDKFIEKCARNCYKSEGSITENSSDKLIGHLINAGHTAMLEHANITVKFTNDMHTYKDLTRHRHASFAIESTRWCNYSNDKFGNELTFIKPNGLDEDSQAYSYWKSACEEAEKCYLAMKAEGATNDQASGVLNQSLKADVIITANIREWRHS